MGRQKTKLFVCLSWLLLLAWFCDSTVVAANAKTTQPDAQQQKSPVEEIRTVRSIIYEWIDAWQRKNFKAYISYYSRDFHSGKTGYGDWRRKKSRLFKRSKTISAEISNLWIFIDSDRARASFVQKYRDDYLSDTGKKTLELIEKDGTWKIVSERWEPIAE
jgi:murein L,D-transpeptidase YafK